VLLAIGFWASMGLLGAYAVASEPVAYIASMNFGIIFLYLLIPSVLILFIGSVVFAIFSKVKYAVVLFAGCLMLPTFFLGGLQGMRAAGLARYEAPGVNDMRPIDEETNGSVIVVFTLESTFEEQQDFSNKVIHPWKEGPGFTGETGVQASIGLGTMKEAVIVSAVRTAVGKAPKGTLRNTRSDEMGRRR
jgi:hypothetical protein